MITDSPEYKKVIDCFYPAHEELPHLWGGYAKFFEPHLPNRLGEVFMAMVSQTIQHLTYANIYRLITFLATPHPKKYQIGVICRPTEEAHRAIQLLKDLGYKINVKSILDTHTPKKEKI